MELRKPLRSPEISWFETLVWTAAEVKVC